MIREIPKEERLKIASRHHHHLIDTVSGKIIEFHSRNERVYYMHYKGEKQCKDAGKLRLEGKEYIVKDGCYSYFSEVCFCAQEVAPSTS